MVSVSLCAQIFFTQSLLREHAAAVVAALQLKPGERERLGAYFTPYLASHVLRWLTAAVPASWEESVVSGAIANRFAISRPLLNLKGDQTTIDQTSDIPKLGGVEWKPVRCNSIKRLQKRM